jgi:hypothetical protein
MKNHYSSYKICRIVSDDLWSKIFRFNKNVRLFKQIGYNYLYSHNVKSPVRKTKSFHTIRFQYRDYSRRKKSIQKFINRKKFRFFYGYLNKRTFKLTYKKSKGAVSYSPISYFMGRYELRLHILFFRASFFTDTIVPYQLVTYGFMFVNGYQVSQNFCLTKIGVFASFSRAFFYPKRLKMRIKRKRYAFPPVNLMVSDYLPVFLPTKYFKFPRHAPKISNLVYEHAWTSYLKLINIHIYIYIY